jgi:hypothetical protein
MTIDATRSSLALVVRQLRNIAASVVANTGPVDVARLAAFSTRISGAAARVEKLSDELLTKSINPAPTAGFHLHAGDCDCIECDCTCHDEGETYDHDEDTCHCKRCDCACHKED